MFAQQLPAPPSLSAIVPAWGWKGWIVSLKAIEDSDQRLQGRAVLYTPPHWVWKEEEGSLYTSGDSLLVGAWRGGVQALSREMILSLGKTEHTPENKD